MKHTVLRWLGWGGALSAALAACLAVFLAWGNPHLALEISQFVKACF